MERLNQKAKLEITAQTLQNKLKRLEIARAKNEFLMQDRKMNMERIQHLRNLATETIIDEEKTIFSSEQKYKLLCSEDEIKSLKKRIFELIKEI